MPLKLTTYHRGSEIPELPGKNTFHSKELFLIYESTPGYKPVFIVATEEGRPVARLLAGIRTNKKLFPPSIVRRCEVYGTGEYFIDDTPANADAREAIFGEMLQHLTTEVLRDSFMIEFRNLDNALFGYKHFRANRYFPINWLRVRNSLHSQRSEDDRVSPSRVRQIKKGIRNGAKVEEARTVEEIQEFSRMLYKIYSSHIRKHFPNIEFFHHMQNRLMRSDQGKIFIVRYKGKIIGGSACIYSENNAYLWFSGGMRKTYAAQYPGILAVWTALKDAYERGYEHLEFMDVGLPFKKHGYRDFVLRFGGKQSSTRRWFRFRWTWLNNLFTKIYV